MTPWTVTHQLPLSMGFPRQEYWSGLPFPFPGDLPDPGVKPMSHALAGGYFTPEPSGKPMFSFNLDKYAGEKLLKYRVGVSLTLRNYNPFSKVILPP